MIGVLCGDEEIDVVREFFELFKTAWERHDRDRPCDVIVATRPVDLSQLEARLVVRFGSDAAVTDRGPGDVSPCELREGALVEGSARRLVLHGPVRLFAEDGRSLMRVVPSGEPVAVERREGSTRVIRCGYDLFGEIGRLLVEGQPPEAAGLPTLDHHIDLLRHWIVDSGLSVVEVPPVPPGYDYAVCLTHDVDFIGIRNHRGDHTMWGFVGRATIGALRDVLTGRASLRTLIRDVRAVLSLPLVYAGLADDFWIDFDDYVELERDLAATYFFVASADRAGATANGPASSKRAVRYGPDDARPWIDRLQARGFEIGLHGIDAWRSVDAGREEGAAIASLAGREALGVRMHWLYFDRDSPTRLERAGFAYDATSGYNETVGFRAGTHQVFRPPGASTLLELPLHIQDTSLFYRRRMHLREPQAWALCESILCSAARHGGIVTISWHTRSLGPERHWGRFYSRLLEHVLAQRVCIRSALETVRWFEQRRSVEFERVASDPQLLRLRRGRGATLEPRGLTVRVHRPAAGPDGVGATYADAPWTDGRERLVEVPPARETPR
jgi:hypothetical protein